MFKRALNATVRSFLFNFYKLRFALGARLAPHQTAVSGAALFSTPTRPSRSKLVAPADMPVPRIHEAVLPSGALTLYEWGDPKAQRTVLLMHGWNGWALQFAAFIQPLLEQGFAIVAMDFTGHGRSAGRRSSLPGFIDTTVELLEELPNLTGIVGHSLGAAAAACTLAQSRNPALKLVLIAPPSSPRVFLEKFAAMLGMPLRLVDAMQRWMEQRYGRSFASISVNRVAPQIPAHTLIIHDPADKIVPFEHGESYARLLNHARLAPLEGWGHFRILQSPDAIRMTVDFVAAHELRHIPQSVSPAW